MRYLIEGESTTAQRISLLKETGPILSYDDAPQIFSFHQGSWPPEVMARKLEAVFKYFPLLSSVLPLFLSLSLSAYSDCGNDEKNTK